MISPLFAQVYSLSALGTFCDLPCAGYDRISVQVVSAGASNVLTVEQSADDGTTWNVVFLRFLGSASNQITSTTIAASSTTGMMVGQLHAARVRVRLTSYGSGTPTVAVTLMRGTDAPNLMTLLPYGATPSGAIGAIGPATAGGATRARVQSAATTNATSVKASAGQIYGWVLGNNHATNRAYLKLYNKASAPTVGSDTPVVTIHLPPSSEQTFSIPVGEAFSTGIAYAITGGAADSDTTAVAADQVTGKLLYA